MTVAGGARHGITVAPVPPPLAPQKLLAGTDDLETVTKLELTVDTTDQAINRLGELCPNLRQLKLNDSQLCSFRDLGTSLRGLRILWLSRSGITDLDGISVLEQLEELYVSFNDIDDLTPLSLHDTLTVLDLEANKVRAMGGGGSGGGGSVWQCPGVACAWV